MTILEKSVLYFLSTNKCLFSYDLVCSASLHLLQFFFCLWNFLLVIFNVFCLLFSKLFFIKIPSLFTWNLKIKIFEDLLFNSNSTFEETEYACVSVSVLMWACVGVSEYDGRMDKSRKYSMRNTKSHLNEYSMIAIFSHAIHFKYT